MPIGENTTVSNKSKNKTYTAVVTQKVLCNKEFELVKGESIPRGIDSKFIQSLISSNLIK